MEPYGEEALREAAKAIASTMRKSEKALLRLKVGTWQHGLTAKSLAAHRLALAFVERERMRGESPCPIPYGESQAELADALLVIASVVGRVERVLPKFAKGTPQHTLAIRRIEALNLSAALMQREMERL